ncbi:MAG: helix-turn-helix transcriptional regulator [Christensenellaceae bacterium]|nr:helix-turn-helix transcriptional regulator [Christensenellaceae bacterium]
MFPRIDMKATGRRIQALREKQGLSVRELQKLLGFDQPQAIYKWQRGESLPTVDHLLMLSRIFGLPMQDILIVDDQDSVFLAIIRRRCA